MPPNTYTLSLKKYKKMLTDNKILRKLTLLQDYPSALFTQTESNTSTANRIKYV